MTSTHSAQPGDGDDAGRTSAARHTHLFGVPSSVLAVRTLLGTVAVTSRFRREKPRAVITSTGEDGKGSLR